MILLYSINLFNVLILDFNTLLNFVRTFKYISSSESFNTVENIFLIFLLFLAFLKIFN